MPNWQTNIVVVVHAWQQLWTTIALMNDTHFLQAENYQHLSKSVPRQD